MLNMCDMWEKARLSETLNSFTVDAVKLLIFFTSKRPYNWHRKCHLHFHFQLHNGSRMEEIYEDRKHLHNIISKSKQSSRKIHFYGQKRELKVCKLRDESKRPEHMLERWRSCATLFGC